MKIRDGKDVEIPDPHIDAYIITGYCNAYKLSELMVLIARNSINCICHGSKTYITGPTKDIRSASFGSHFMFIVGNKPIYKLLAELEEICDRWPELKYEKLNQGELDEK